MASGDAALTGAVTVELPGQDYAGTVITSSLDGPSTVRTRIVGGSDGIGRQLRDKWYRGSPTLGSIVGDIMRECGETLDAASAGLDVVVPSYQREAGTASAALDDVLSRHGLDWRITPSGRVLVGPPDAYPATDDPGQFLEDDGVRMLFAPEAATAPVGSSVRGLPVTRAVIDVTPSSLRASLYYTRQAVPTRRELPVVTAGVDSQSGDTLDVIAGARVGLTQVPLYGGLPGARSVCQPGTSTVVGYSGGDPRTPFAVGHRGGSGGCLLGYLVIGVAPGPPAVLLPPQFFDGSPAGLLAATAAQAAMAATPAAAFTVPLTTAEVTEQ